MSESHNELDIAGSLTYVAHMESMDEWFSFKQVLNQKERLPHFSEREIWWCSVGVNVGFEVYGKGSVFTRPVLIIRKFGASTFLGVPLTSSPKAGYYRIPYHMSGKDGFIVLDQLRTYDARRLVNDKCIKKMHETEFAKLKTAMRDKLNLEG